MDEIIYKQFQQHLKQGDKESARQLITLYVKENPDDAEAWYLVAGVAVNKTQRIALLNKVLQIDPLHTKASHALEKLQAQSATAITSPAKSPYRNLIIVGLGGILILALASVIFLMLQDKNTTDAVIDLPTRVSVVLETETSTPTDTPLPTDTPSATNTPRPTRTPAPTNTPRPTRTPRPTNTPQLGTRANPFNYDYSLGVTTGRFSDEVIVLNGLYRNVDHLIDSINMFNSKPSTGHEWALLDVEINCLKNPNTSCTYSNWDFQIMDTNNGQAYDGDLFVDLDGLELPKEIYGDSTASGYIGFIIPKSTSIHDLLLIYKPEMFREDRYFFELTELYLD